jgi:Glycosyl hydrolase family 65, N-terminal domain
MTDSDLILTWPERADTWFEAAPVGNGRLGAMVFGGAEGRVQVNDSTVWSGTPGGPAAGLAEVLAAGAGPERLARVRDAIRAGAYREAEALLMSFEGRYTQEYLPFVDLWLGAEGAECRGRTLNLDSGVATEESVVDGRRLRRTVFASRPAGVLCVDVAADRPVDLLLRLTSPLRAAQRSASPVGLTLGVDVPVDGAPLHEPEVANPLRYADEPGAGPDGYDPFAAAVAALDTDGTVTVLTDGLAITGATRALVALASSTSAADAWSGAVPVDRDEHVRRATDRARAAVVQGGTALRRAHEDDLRALLGAARLTVGTRRGRIAAADVLSGADDRLAATVLVAFGRYLLASASRPGGGPPANLQGIWNDQPRPAWSSNYTLNINTEMNYWAAETAGLAECHEPLLDLVDRLTRTGADVARELYGARGWVAHHNTDMWGWALPVGMGHGNPSWAIWMMGGAWLTQHVWDRWDFGRDRDYLRERAWPVLRGCAEFCLDWLVEGPGGALDTIPSTSPENLFAGPDGHPESLGASVPMDVAFVRAVFTRCLAAADELGLDDPVTGEIRAALPRLRPTLTTADGRLREWAEDHVEADPGHRHMSHLIAVHPLGQIDPDATPELAEAARRVLDQRGPGAMGWSWAWKVALRAWLRDGDTAAGLLREAARPLPGDPTRPAPVDGSEWGGLLPNLFSSHPPFQIDGNYGLAAAIVELVLQSQNGVLRLLPALPSGWPDGEARGLRARGGLAVDLAWRAGRLTEATVRRVAGEAGPVRVHHGDREIGFVLAPGDEVRLGAEELTPC